MYVCVCVYVCMYVCTCMYVRMYMCMHACMYVCMYVCTCMYVCMYVHVCQPLLTTKIKQAKYFVRRIIRYISHVYASSKSHSDEN